MTNYLVKFSGTLFDKKIVDGDVTCIKLTGDYCTSADSENDALANVAAKIAASYNHPVRIHDLKIYLPFSGQSQIDRTIKRGGTKKTQLV